MSDYNGRKGCMLMKRIYALICCAVAISATVFALENTVSAGGVEAHTDLSLTISSLPETLALKRADFIFRLKKIMIVYLCMKLLMSSLRNRPPAPPKLGLLKRGRKR
jgi:hypothetical protein